MVGRKSVCLKYSTFKYFSHICSAVACDVFDPVACRKTCRRGGSLSRTAELMKKAAQMISVSGSFGFPAEILRVSAGVVTLDVTVLDTLQALASLNDV